MIYQGLAIDAPVYFESINLPIPLFTNPADFFMKITYVPFLKSKDDIKQID